MSSKLKIPELALLNDAFFLCWQHRPPAAWKCLAVQCPDRNAKGSASQPHPGAHGQQGSAGDMFSPTLLGISSLTLPWASKLRTPPPGSPPLLDLAPSRVVCASLTYPPSWRYCHYCPLIYPPQTKSTLKAGLGLILSEIPVPGMRKGCLWPASASFRSSI